jgi:hypothetical protein
VSGVAERHGDDEGGGGISPPRVRYCGTNELVREFRRCEKARHRMRTSN